MNTEDGFRISVIIPVLNEANAIEAIQTDLEPFREAGHEIIVVDGGSSDKTTELASHFANRVIHASAGRAIQMNAGAAAASGELLWFLHADTRVPAEAANILQQAIREGDWGRFDLRLSGKHPLFRLIEQMISLRSRLTGIATGDQGIFVRQQLFRDIGGFPEIPLMEDIALSKILRSVQRPRCLRLRLETSSRRWEERGILRTILLMWRLRLAYFFGTDPAELARRYV